MSRQAFDWKRFLVAHRIPFVDSGANVKRGEINVRCPLCGPRDPSYHLGFNLRTGAYSCWRNSLHRGTSPIRIIRSLLGVSFEEAARIAGIESDAPLEPLDELSARLRALDLPGESLRPFQTYRRESTWRRVSPNVLGGRFWAYLLRRGFRPEDVKAVVRQYDLFAALTGPQSYRLILPIYFRGAMVGWTGRAITKRAQIRYKTFPVGEESIGPRIVYNFDGAAKGGKVLVVVEGPLDVLKLDFYGQKFGVRSVGTLGLDLSFEKVGLVAELSEKFDRTVVLYDSGAERQTLTALSSLTLVGAEFCPKPLGFDDPGALSPFEAESLSRSLLRM